MYIFYLRQIFLNVQHKSLWKSGEVGPRILNTGTIWI